MIAFPKLPALRGRRALYEACGFVSSLPRMSYQDAAVKLFERTADRTRIELRVLNFAITHQGAAHGEYSVVKVDNNGYHWPVARWKKYPEGWR